MRNCLYCNTPFEEKRVTHVYCRERCNVYYNKEKRKEYLTNVIEDLPGEEWRAIDGYPNYMVSNKIRVKDLKFNKLKNTKTIPVVLGERVHYKGIGLSNEFGGKYFPLHRLMALAFVPNPHNKPFVNHIDSNPENNNIENLEWCTNQENIQHMVNSGRNTYLKGSCHRLTKWTEMDIVKMLRLSKQGVRNMDICKMYGITKDAVSRIVCNKSWKHIDRSLI